MNITVEQLGIAKAIRVHTVANGDIDPEEELINKQWECEHENVQTISEVELDPIFPDSTSLFHGEIYVCEDCNKELDND